MGLQEDLQKAISSCEECKSTRGEKRADARKIVLDVLSEECPESLAGVYWDCQKSYCPATDPLVADETRRYLKALG